MTGIVKCSWEVAAEVQMFQKSLKQTDVGNNNLNFY